MIEPAEDVSAGRREAPGLPSPAPREARRASVDAVLQWAWDAGTFTSNDAMPATGLTRSTTIEAVDELIDIGLLRELPNAREAGAYRKGRPSRRFELNAEGAVVVGVDAGRLHLTAIVADLRGTVLGVTHKRSDVLPGREHDQETDAASRRRDLIRTTIDKALHAAGRRRADVLAVCIGVPAPVDSVGRSPDHRTGFWTRMNPDLRGLVAEWAPIVRVENDASLAAVAEGATGAAREHRDYVALLAGERLGAGVVIDGQLLRGAHGGVGEAVAFDHVEGVGGAYGLGYRLAEWARADIEAGVIPEGHPLAGARAGVGRGAGGGAGAGDGAGGGAGVGGGVGVGAVGGGVGADAGVGVDAKSVLELARAGDPWAMGLVERAGAWLARLVGVYGTFYDPSLIVVAGAVADSLDPVIAAARRLVAAELDLPAPEIVASSLGADVVAVGATMAAVESARAGVLALRELPPGLAPDAAAASA
ncbi:ROK family protein [Microbacterium sp. F51-2R]|uniref:ROK family protein n=1 Tax=Microbacterium sp. F51-2R TaxID=3445777 RepID=UPI003FA04DED